MKTDIIQIDNQGNGFANAVKLTEKTAEFQGLTSQETIRMKMITEEMLSLARSVTGEMEASFWLECAGKAFEVNMTTHTVMDKEKRYKLINSATSRKNEAAGSFLGKLRDAFEQAMTSEADHTYYELPEDVSVSYVEDSEWDGYERSVLKQIADDVKVYIKGGLVRMTVTKDFGASSKG